MEERQVEELFKSVDPYFYSPLSAPCFYNFLLSAPSYSLVHALMYSLEETLLPVIRGSLLLTFTLDTF